MLSECESFPGLDESVLLDTFSGPWGFKRLCGVVVLSGRDESIGLAALFCTEVYRVLISNGSA